MSKERHVPKDATLTSIKLSEEDKAAINWIKSARRRRGEERDRMNDVLVDALWYLLEKVEGKSRSDISTMIPPAVPAKTSQGNVTEMPKKSNTKRR